jgi:uncharacterized membrane protein YkvI
MRSKVIILITAFVLVASAVAVVAGAGADSTRLPPISAPEMLAKMRWC